MNANSASEPRKPPRRQRISVDRADCRRDEVAGIVIHRELKEKRRNPLQNALTQNVLQAVSQYWSRTSGQANQAAARDLVQIAERVQDDDAERQQVVGRNSVSRL